MLTHKTDDHLYFETIKQDKIKLEPLAQSQRSDITVISKTWWVEFCDGSATLGGCRLFRRDGQGRQGRVVLYAVEDLEYMKFTVGNDTIKHLWVRIKVKTNNETSLWKSAKDYLARTITLMNYSLRN